MPVVWDMMPIVTIYIMHMINLKNVVIIEEQSERSTVNDSLDNSEINYSLRDGSSVFDLVNARGS